MAVCLEKNVRSNYMLPTVYFVYKETCSLNEKEWGNIYYANPNQKKKLTLIPGDVNFEGENTTRDHRGSFHNDKETQFLKDITIIIVSY